MTLNKRTIVLRGHPVQNEEGSAGAAIKPGYLVDGVSTINPSAVTTAVPVPRTFALERDELGTGVDSRYPGVGTGSPDYAIGDKVKVGAFSGGSRVLAWIASGQNISENQKLESAGDGTLKAFASGTCVARALEAVNATSLVNLRVEVM